MKLQIGEVVTMSPSSGYYTPGFSKAHTSNPSNIPGVVLEVRMDQVAVKWSNGLKNSYRTNDLVLFKLIEKKDLLSLINYKSSKEVFPEIERIPEDLTEDLLLEIGLENVITYLNRYDKCLAYNEEIIKLLFKILSENIQKITQEANQEDDFKQLIKMIEQINNKKLKKEMLVKEIEETIDNYTKEKTSKITDELSKILEVPETNSAFSTNSNYYKALEKLTKKKKYVITPDPSLVHDLSFDSTLSYEEE